MTDLLTIAVLIACALSCSLTVLLGEHLYRCLTKQSHGDRADADGVVGDLPFIPSDFPIHHAGGDKL